MGRYECDYCCTLTDAEYVKYCNVCKQYFCDRCKDLVECEKCSPKCRFKVFFCEECLPKHDCEKTIKENRELEDKIYPKKHIEQVNASLCTPKKLKPFLPEDE